MPEWLSYLLFGAFISFMICTMSIFIWTQNVQVRIWNHKVTARDRKIAKLLRINVG